MPLPHYETLEVSISDRVASVKLARPDAGNALNSVLARELADAAATLAADRGVRAVVLTGAGRFFCAGGDLKEMIGFGADAHQRVKRLADDAHRAISTLVRMTAPVIAAVNGTAAGGGFSLAMSADLVVAAESARFTTAYTNAALSPDGSSTYFLPRLIGLRKTQELMFTNRTLTAREAKDWGLVNDVHPDGELLARALELAARLAKGPLDAHGATKRLLLQTFGNSLETQMELEGEHIAQCAASADGQEGIGAFAAKRTPRFS